ncbi:MAG: endo-1,4-beta-xylanase [Candidatus Omnitrophica bacterium]|nr:endo-1,4-beta-xylanase [Candidatus Omnitrophota bacterium]
MPIAKTVTLIASVLLLTSASHSDDLSQQIVQNRMGNLIVYADPGANVQIEQVRHEFWFGAALSNWMFQPGNTSLDAQKYKEVFLENFNSAVTENAVKWYSMERRKGQVDYSIVDSMLEWTDENDIPLRGHNLFWGVSQFVQPWLKELSDDELREAIRNRAITMGKRYKGRFVEYDLNNEMIHENFYEKRLGSGITKQMTDWFRQEDPDTPLYVNDYDILTGNRLDDYVQHIRGLLNADIPIGGIGVQGHFHGETFDADALQKSLDVLAQLNLPIRITEFNMPGQKSVYYKERRAKLTDEQEKQKAEELVKYYRICFAHPAVEGILMWGFWEGANWIPTSSLYLRDWTPTPAAHAYRDLVFNEWWTKYDGKTDDDGHCQVKAFYGKYRVKVNDKVKFVKLEKKDGEKTVSFLE